MGKLRLQKVKPIDEGYSAHVAKTPILICVTPGHWVTPGTWDRMGVGSIRMQKPIRSLSGCACSVPAAICASALACLSRGSCVHAGVVGGNCPDGVTVCSSTGVGFCSPDRAATRGKTARTPRAVPTPTRRTQGSRQGLTSSPRQPRPSARLGLRPAPTSAPRGPRPLPAVVARSRALRRRSAGR